MQTVKILNPAHGDGWTSIRRAQKYVDRGRAIWHKRSNGRLEIKFLKGHPRDAKVRASKPLPTYDGYDRRNTPLTLEEQSNVPLSGSAPAVAKVDFPTIQRSNVQLNNT